MLKVIRNFEIEPEPAKQTPSVALVQIGSAEASRKLHLTVHVKHKVLVNALKRFGALSC